eukprot:TRINITY_DN260_c0_g1_i3.p1 TRINITY_DN260_c0_g1~~TRINITY_DN260_c0_g1_i3.p1  ORF type:complete len:138 (+),score=2.96 TRINITY_DN260_c0_g1_i3:124-537(+)
MASVAEDLVLCPITQEPMLDAVFCVPSGRTYSAGAIREVIRFRGCDPFTNIPITIADLRPNYPIRQAAEQWVRDCGEAEEPRDSSAWEERVVKLEETVEVQRKCFDEGCARLEELAQRARRRLRCRSKETKERKERV